MMLLHEYCKSLEQESENAGERVRCVRKTSHLLLVEVVLHILRGIKRFSHYTRLKSIIIRKEAIDYHNSKIQKHHYFEDSDILDFSCYYLFEENLIKYEI